MSKRTIYLICIPFLVALVAGGGWWANRAGLLSQWLAPVAQTASSVSAGVEAQPGQPGQSGQSGRHGRPGQIGTITGTMTMTMPFGGGDNGFPRRPTAWLRPMAWADRAAHLRMDSGRRVWALLALRLPLCQALRL